MAFIKRGDAEKIIILPNEEVLDDESTKQALKKARQGSQKVRNIGKDGNVKDNQKIN